VTRTRRRNLSAAPERNDRIDGPTLDIRETTGLPAPTRPMVFYTFRDEKTEKKGKGMVLQT